MEQKDLSNFGRGPPKEQSYQVWLKSKLIGVLQQNYFNCSALLAKMAAELKI